MARTSLLPRTSLLDEYATDSVAKNTGPICKLSKERGF